MKIKTQLALSILETLTNEDLPEVIIPATEGSYSLLELYEIAWLLAEGKIKQWDFDWEDENDARLDTISHLEVNMLIQKSHDDAYLNDNLRLLWAWYPAYALTLMLNENEALELVVEDHEYDLIISADTIAKEALLNPKLCEYQDTLAVIQGLPTTRQGAYDLLNHKYADSSESITFCESVYPFLIIYCMSRPDHYDATLENNHKPAFYLGNAHYVSSFDMMDSDHSNRNLHMEIDGWY